VRAYLHGGPRDGQVIEVDRLRPRLLVAVPQLVTLAEGVDPSPVGPAIRVVEYVRRAGEWRRFLTADDYDVCTCASCERAQS
jgi:hypothetical protein